MTKAPRKPGTPTARQIKDGTAAPRTRKKKAVAVVDAPIVEVPVEASAPVAEVAIPVVAFEASTAPVSETIQAPVLPVEPVVTPEVPSVVARDAKKPGFLKRLARFFSGKSE